MIGFEGMTAADVVETLAEDPSVLEVWKERLAAGVLNKAELALLADLATALLSLDQGVLKTLERLECRRPDQLKYWEQRVRDVRALAEKVNGLWYSAPASATSAAAAPDGGGL